jgi:hypothetical protein
MYIHVEGRKEVRKEGWLWHEGGTVVEVMQEGKGVRKEGE